MTVGLAILSLLGTGVILYTTGYMQIGLNKTCSYAQGTGLSCQAFFENGLNTGGKNVMKSWVVIQSGIGIGAFAFILSSIVVTIYAGRVQRNERVNKTLIDINGSSSGGAGLEFESPPEQKGNGPAPIAAIPPPNSVIHHTREYYVEPDVESLITIGPADTSYFAPSASKSTPLPRNNYPSNSHYQRQNSNSSVNYNNRQPRGRLNSAASLRDYSGYEHNYNPNPRHNPPSHGHDDGSRRQDPYSNRSNSNARYR